MTPFPIRLYNSLSREKEWLFPKETLLPGQVVKIYTCGPTVYDYAHIGNFRTYVFEDLLRRTLLFFGYFVQQAMNLTDVDDKTIKGALREGISLADFTARYKKAFFDDLQTLSIQPVEFYPAATEYLPAMIEMISTLVEKGIAYRGGDGSIYFAIQRFAKYGRLSHLPMESLKAGASARVASDEYEKEAVADFVLWKKHDPVRDGNLFWESPFGPGRPGWHIECSAMATRLLGETLDIHAGGIDNLFPHHENEIAQSEACTGKLFVRLWMHAEHLLVDHKKMAKSAGNFYTLRDLLQKGYTGAQVRYLLLQTHYKTPLNFTFQALESAKHSLDRLKSCVRRLQSLDAEILCPEAQRIAHRIESGFREALADDLNISAALASLFDGVREIHVLCEEEKLGHSGAQLLLDTFARLDKVLGLLFTESPPSIPTQVLDLFQQRQAAREAKNWSLADSLRQEIHALGFTVEDSPKGPHLKAL